MSRIKRASALVLLLALGGARAESDLISASLAVPESVNYHTETVELTSISRSYALGGYEYYPHSVYAAYEGAQAKYLRHLVARGDTVQAGDPIAEVEIVASSSELDTAQLTLTRAKEGYERGTADKTKALELLRKSVYEEPNPTKRAMLELDVRSAQLALDQYILRQEYEIAQLEKRLSELVALRESTVVYAPVGGQVTDIAFTRPGTPISDGYVLLTIFSTDDMLVYTANDNGYLRYNMPVTITTGNNKNRTEITGRVVACDDMLPESEKRGGALIRLDPYDPEEVTLRNMSISADVFYLDGVLVLPRKAVTLEGGKYYVTKLTDGAVQKRFVNVLHQTQTHVWIGQGISEGEVVILD